MKNGPSQQSPGDRAYSALYFNLLADFFNKIGTFATFCCAVKSGRSNSHLNIGVPRMKAITIVAGAGG